MLHCSIPNLKDEQSPVISVSGRSLLPYCHIHLKDSDYLTANRRDPELHSLLNVDPNTRVIEFSSLGIGTSVRRCKYLYFYSQKCDVIQNEILPCT